MFKKQFHGTFFRKKIDKLFLVRCFCWFLYMSNEFEEFNRFESKAVGIGLKSMFFWRLTHFKCKVIHFHRNDCQWSGTFDKTTVMHALLVFFFLLLSVPTKCYSQCISCELWLSCLVCVNVNTSHNDWQFTIYLLQYTEFPLIMEMWHIQFFAYTHSGQKTHRYCCYCNVDHIESETAHTKYETKRKQTIRIICVFLKALW